MVPEEKHHKKTKFTPEDGGRQRVGIAYLIDERSLPRVVPNRAGRDARLVAREDGGGGGSGRGGGGGGDPAHFSPKEYRY